MPSFRPLVVLSVLAPLFGVRADADPFEGVEAAKPVPPAPPEDGWDRDLLFRKEVYLQVSAQDGQRTFARESLGFEALKRFAGPTSTRASVNVQARLVRRDRPMETSNDPMGDPGWVLELHNLYADVYSVFGPVGRFNVRAGRFYLPFGLNLQTDTHGTLLQLSNERNFGYERDWYAGLWGSAGPHLRYDAYWMAGSGETLSFQGQKGLFGGRLALSERHRDALGLEGGMAFMAGERLSRMAASRSPSVGSRAGSDHEVDTVRFGPDLRYAFLAPGGLATATAEWSAGRDGPDAVATTLYQADWLGADRRWGAAVQYRRFWQDMPMGGRADASVAWELTRYLRNDVGNTTLHWIKLNVERRLERMEGHAGAVVTLQYYRYW